MVPLLPVFQVWYRAGYELTLLVDDAGQETGVLDWLIDAVKPDASLKYELVTLKKAA